MKEIIEERRKIWMERLKDFRDALKFATHKEAVEAMDKVRVAAAKTAELANTRWLG